MLRRIGALYSQQQQYIVVLGKTNGMMSRSESTTGCSCSRRFSLLLIVLVFSIFVINVEISEICATTNSEVRETMLSPPRSYDPMRICQQNYFINSVQPSFSEISTKMDEWLNREVEIERSLVHETRNDYTPRRFAAFQEMATCNKTCVGGECGKDESKNICGLANLQEPCVIYSIGGNNQWAFERDLLQKTACDIHTFDCTGPLSRFDPPKNERLHFHHVCLGMKSLPAPNITKGKKRKDIVGEVWTLEEMQSTLHHNRIDLLKMDIEGFEWPVMYHWHDLFDIRGDTSVLPMQIVVEIHYRTQMKDLSATRGDFKNAQDMVQLQSHLLKMGYATIINDLNPYCTHCTELTLMRIRCPIETLMLNMATSGLR